MVLARPLLNIDTRGVFIMQKSDRQYCVYIHTNNFNNKKYIGITCRSPEVRWNHGRGYLTNTHFWRAIEKDGWENFSHDIVAEGLTKQDAHKLEMELIQFHNTTNSEFGYNHSCGGEGGARYPRESDKTAARKQTCKKQYEKLKQDSTRYAAYLEANKQLHRDSYQDPVKREQIRERLNKHKQRYRQDQTYLEKDRAATKKIREEVKDLRNQLLQLIEISREKFTEEDLYLITARTETRKNYICNSKIKLQIILDKVSKN